MNVAGRLAARMNAIAALAICVFLLAIAAWATVSAIRGVAPSRGMLMFAAICELELVLQALIALLVIAKGHHLPSIGEYLGYLFVTVVLVPYGIVRARGPEPGRWDSAALAAIAVAVAIAVLRLLYLW
jgi:hypothetical protein